MKKYIIFCLLTVLVLSKASAQRRSSNDLTDFEYRRSSLYSLLISHSDKKFNEEIEDCFLQIPIPDTYNDHDLSIKIVSFEGELEMEKVKKGQTAQGIPAINNFLEENEVASRLIGKWHQRNMDTGMYDLELISKRGLYAASEADKARAAASIRGNSMLEDAGEDLIPNTFVLVNDITYIDKSKGSQTVGTVIKILGAAASAATGNRNYEGLGNTLGDVAESFKGFSVKVQTSLYQLVWNEESKAEFYNVWEAGEHGDATAFENIRNKFKLKYVGNQVSSGSTTSFLGIREDQPEKMVRKACQRALDENIANLQQNFQAFQIKVPLENVEPLEAKVGKKEGITESSLFEVLEPQKENGKIVYKKVGEVKPVQNLIWDNRYMAEEEMAEGATLGCTTFKKVNGKDFLPGYLIRQIK